MSPQAPELSGLSQVRGPYLGEVPMTLGYRHTSAKTAAVYFLRGRQLVVRSDGQPSDRLPLRCRPTAIAIVQLGRHYTRREMDFPAAGGGRFFQGAIDVVWRVTDPILVAEQQLEDVGILLPDLTYRLRTITARYRINDLVGVSAEVDDFLRSPSWQSIGQDHGLDARVYVQLGLDEAGVKGESEFDQDEIQARLEAKRRERLIGVLAQGDLERAGALAASDPDNLASAIKMLNESDRANRQEMVRFFQYMLDNGIVSRGQLSEQARTMIDWFNGGGDLSTPVRAGMQRAIDSSRSPVRELTPASGRDDSGRTADREPRRPTRPAPAWDEDLEPSPRERTAPVPRNWDEDDEPPAPRRDRDRRARNLGPRPDEDPGLSSVDSDRTHRAGPGRYDAYPEDHETRYVPSRRTDRDAEDDWSDPGANMQSSSRRDDWADDEWGR